MAVLQWNDGLNVGVGFMDADHAAAADAINALADAVDAATRIPLLQHFITHCQDHFGREEAMMAQTGFFAAGCHGDEHKRVLAELDLVLTRLRSGDAQDAYFQSNLPNWLKNHRDTMDFVTAEFAGRAGFVG